MPVSIEVRNGKHCVVEPDGTVVPSGCYDTRDEALPRQRAINANIDKDFRDLESSVDYLQLLDEPTVPIESVTISGTDPTWHVLGAKPMADEAKVETKEDGVEEKDEKFFDMIKLGPMSFSELDEIREAQKKDMGIKRVVSDFMSIVGNIIQFPSEKGAAADIKALMKEMDDRIPEEDEGPENASEKETISAEVETNSSLFTIWKDEATGEYRWLGVYSNKFRDDDSPAEILAEEAHLRFIERVEKGELEYPDLYVWHIPAAIGKANLLAFDNAGFSIAAGTVEEDFAIALSKSDSDLAMSHGMPAQHIRRDDADKTVITDYVSSEVSVLPRFAAANKMTDFYILEEEEAKMAIIPDNKRQQIADLLGDELTGRLEATLDEKGTKALAEGIEFKEEQPVEEEVDETTEEKTEEEPVEETTTEEPVAEVEEEAEEAEESVEESETDASGTDEDMLSKQELVEALGFIVDSLTQQNKAVLESVETLNQRIDQLEGNVGELKESDETKVAQLAANTPEASLQAIMAARMQAGASVIGNPATRVHGNSALAKESPKETSEEAVTEEGGLFFNKW